MNLSSRAHKNLQSALAGALLGGLMASPRAGAAAVLNGLTAFTQGVLPFLFPFSCLAQLLACGRRAPLGHDDGRGEPHVLCGHAGAVAG